MRCQPAACGGETSSSIPAIPPSGSEDGALDRRKGKRGNDTHPSGMTHISRSFSGVSEKATLLPNKAGVANETSGERSG